MTIKILPTQQLIVFLYKQQHRVKDLYICMGLKQEGEYQGIVMQTTQ